MKTLEQQLLDYGFHPSFSPELTDSWKEIKDENLGKVAYIYRVYNSSKGIIKNFTFSYWKAGDLGITFTENPDKITQKELKDFHKKDKEFEKELYLQKEVEEEIIAAESSQFISECVPLITGNDYLKLKGFETPPTTVLRHRDNVDTIIVPIYDEKNKVVSWQEIYHDGQKHIKRGSKIRGCFGFIQGKGSILYYAEGYATALSIHKATQSSVVVAMSSSNFVNATKNAHKIYKETFKYHVVCADDDKHNPRNPGIVAGKTAAKEIRGLFRSPRFSKLDGKNTTDFNDLMVKDGIETVFNQLLLDDVELADIENKLALYYLGYDRQNNFYLSSKENHNIIALKDITQQDLTSLMPLSFWRDNFGVITKTGETMVDWLQVSSDLKEKCRLKGNYDEKEQLGIGIYKDEGRVVVNTGKSIIVDDEELNLRQIESKKVYKQDTPIDNFLHYPKLTDEDSLKIVDIFKTLALSEPHVEVKYLLGFCVSSILSGITTWRSHVYVTGERGSGKSTLLKNILAPLLSAFGAREGTLITSTGVGASQFISGYSGPVLMDEAETESTRAQTQIKTFLETCRAASSKGEKTRGTPSGVAVREKYSFSALIMSIVPSVIETADQSRFTFVKMGKGSQEQFEVLKKKLPLLETAGVSQGFVRRVYENKDYILRNIETAKQIVAENVGDMRTAEQYGTLLGSYFTMEHEGLLTEDDKNVIKNISIGSQSMSDGAEHDSANEALSIILDSQILDNEKRMTTLGDLLQRDNIDDEVKDLISSTGILVSHRKKEGLGILVRKTKYLAKIMEGTKFRGDVFEVLKTIPGSIHGPKSQTKHKQRIFKGVWVPLSGVFEPLSDQDRINKLREEKF